MDIKLDTSIKDIIDSTYKIDSSVFIGIEERRQTSNAVTSSINGILNSSPTAPEVPKDSNNVVEDIANKSNYNYTLKERELNSLLNLITLTDASIDKTAELIRKIDSKIVTLINEINSSINQVKSAYDFRISVGCRSNLIWNKIGVTTGYNVGIGSTITLVNYIVIKNPNDLVTTNYYGLKYYQKPSNRDYGTNVISEFNGSISVGSQTLAVLGVAGTEGIQLGDEILDNLITPVAFNLNNLPKVVGFGTTAIIGVNTTILGNVVSSGSTEIAYISIGSTSNISIGNYVINSSIFTSDTKVVGFGTTVSKIVYYDVGSSITTSADLVVPSILLSNGSISSATNSSFGFGTSTQYNSILLNTTSNLTVENKVFTAIRRTFDITQNFNFTNNPSNPITIGIIDNQRIGLGHKTQLVNNGNSSGPSQWNEILQTPEPIIGAGKITYYQGQVSWPHQLLFGYASEGTVYTFPLDIVPTYTTISPVGLVSTSSTCASCDSAIATAESNLQTKLNQNIPEIQKLINASIPIRNYRNEDEVKAWSYVQSASYIRSEMSKIKTELESLKTFDYNTL